MSQSVFLPVKPSLSYILIGICVRVKSSGLAGGWQMPGPRAVQHYFANAPPPGGGGRWVQVELTDALRQTGDVKCKLKISRNSE